MYCQLDFISEIVSDLDSKYKSLSPTKGKIRYVFIYLLSVGIIAFLTVRYTSPVFFSLILRYVSFLDNNLGKAVLLISYLGVLLLCVQKVLKFGQNYLKSMMLKSHASATPNAEEIINEYHKDPGRLHNELFADYLISNNIVVDNLVAFKELVNASGSIKNDIRPINVLKANKKIYLVVVLLGALLQLFTEDIKKIFIELYTHYSQIIHWSAWILIFIIYFYMLYSTIMINPNFRKRNILYCIEIAIIYLNTRSLKKHNKG